MTLAIEEIRALEQFRHAEGRRWKSKLNEMWEKGGYPGHEDKAAILQGVRNKIGPSGLAKYQFKPTIGMRVKVRPGVKIEIDYDDFGEGKYGPISRSGKVAVEAGDLGTVEDVDTDYIRVHGKTGWFVWIREKNVTAVLEKEEMEPA